MAIHLLIKRIFPALMLLSASCAKEIDLNIPEYEPRLVVDGWIDIGQPARVLITTTVNFSDPIDSSSYLDIVMTRAKITLYQDGVAEVLTLRKDTSYFPPHVYMSNKTRGRIGAEYTIKAEYDGQVATATSKILPPPQIDSAWFALDKGQDSLGFIWLKIKDPQHKSSYYRVQTKRVNRDKRYVGAQISAFDGKIFPEEEFCIPVYKGLMNISEKMQEHRFKIGDTVSICISSIGEREFQCWSYFDKAILTTGNPFTTSGNNLPTNMSNGYGIWTAYGNAFATVICR